MATYEELFNLRSYSPLLNRITTAITVKCKLVIDDEGATAKQKDWAKTYYKTPETLKKEVIWPVLEANKGASVSTIQNAQDNTVQNNVNDVIDDLISDLI